MNDDDDDRRVEWFEEQAYKSDDVEYCMASFVFGVVVGAMLTLLPFILVLLIGD